MTSKNLKEYETSLQGHNYLRLHNSHLVHLAEARKHIKADGGYIEPDDGSQVPVPTSHKEAFLEQMKCLL